MLFGKYIFIITEDMEKKCDNLKINIAPTAHTNKND